jgi:hypothetical protein
MSDPRSDDDATTELISRLRVIESQPLTDRADAYGAIHEELVRRLESGSAEAESRRATQPAPRG